jgi:SAM-dependent methyltransferase
MERMLMNDRYDSLKAKIKKLYEKSAKEFGDTPPGVFWKDEVTHNLRLRIISEVGIVEGCSVLDVGCGYGALWGYLLERGIRNIRYTGIDIVASLVGMAKKRFGDSAEFKVADVMKIDQEYDFVLNLGGFHLKPDCSDLDWFQNFVCPMISKMWKLTRVGLAFTLMTDMVDYRNSNLYYANPVEVLDFVRRTFSRYVVLRHDYRLYEFTLYVYKHGKT